VSSYLTGIVVASSHEGVTERTLTDGFPRHPTPLVSTPQPSTNRQKKKTPSPDLDPSHVIA